VGPWFFAFGIVLLILVLLAGDVGKGAQRWLNLYVIRFQPSEMMKLVTPMMLAWYLCEKPFPPKVTSLIISLGLVILPTMLIAKQPDLGTALLVAAAGFFVVFFWRYSLAGFVRGVVYHAGADSGVMAVYARLSEAAGADPVRPAK